MKNVCEANDNHFVSSSYSILVWDTALQSPFSINYALKRRNERNGPKIAKEVTIN